MPSFDTVSELDLQEMDNAINQVQKELGTRFDFKGSKSSLLFDKAQKAMTILADDDMKLRAIQQMIESKMAKRGLDLRCLDYGKEETATGSMIRVKVKLKEGIAKDAAKDIIKKIKDSKLKVTAQVLDEKVRVTAKSIDDLQSVIQLLKRESFELPLQFVNMKS